MNQPEPMRAVIGRNVQQLRKAQGMTAEELGRRARKRGLNWATSRVSDLENGRKPVSLAEMLVLAQVLNDGPRVTLADLLAGADSVEVTDTFHIPGDDLHRALSGGQVNIYPNGKNRHDARERHFARLEHVNQAFDYLGLDDWELLERAAVATIGAAEDKAAKSLDVPRLVVEVAAQSLWGQSLTERRDSLVSADSTPQARGHVTRSLIAELGKYIKDRHGDD